MGPFAPALTPRIPPDPRGQGCMVESGTGVGDPEGSALVGPLMIIPRPPQRFFARAAEGERRVKNDVKERRSGCDHTSTNAPDPIRTPQLSVHGRDGFSRRLPAIMRFEPLFRREMPSLAPNFTCMYLRGGKCALTSQRGRRVVNEARRRGNGPDRTGTNDPDPTRPPRPWVIGRELHRGG
ncbi:hypothetical protein Ancab_025130 [Ancistrocladus abbreviatus]